MAFADGKLMSQHRERKKKVNVKTRSEKKDKEDKKRKDHIAVEPNSPGAMPHFKFEIRITRNNYLRLTKVFVRVYVST